jgi:xylulokinase
MKVENMTGKYILGIDLGTSSVKAVLFAAQTLTLAAAAARQYPVHHPQPGYAEQDPHDWWAGTISAVREVLDQVPQGQVIAMGLAGQMHGLVCLDAQQNPLRPAIIWADTRAMAEVEELFAFHEEYPSAMPGPPAAGYTAVSVLWLSRHEPDILSQSKTILSPKDYVRLRLTGEARTDPSDAAGMWLFDIAAGTWAEDVVARCALQMEQLPPVSPSSAVCGTLTQPAAQELGLPAGLPVVTGSADLPAQALGHGIIDPSSILVTVGTGGQVFRPRLKPQPDPHGRLYLFPHNVPDRWYAQAAILAGGLSLRRLRDILGLSGRADAYNHLSKLASSVPAGAEGLLFLPYLAGERTPYNDPQAAGLFLGLRLHHGSGHLARAVMEGVGFALLDCLTLVDGAAAITLSGGVTQSDIWPQILADIWQRPFSIPTIEVPRACLGAAILAGVGVGLFKDGREGTAVRPEPATIIYPEERSIYQDRYAQYRRLYPLLKEEMHLLAPR